MISAWHFHELLISSLIMPGDLNRPYFSEMEVGADCDFAKGKSKGLRSKKLAFTAPCLR